MSFFYKFPAGLGQLFLNIFGDGGKSTVDAKSSTKKHWVRACDEAKRSIKQAVGWSLKDYLVDAKDIPAQAYFGNGVYAWREPELNNMWVRGLYNLNGMVSSAIGPEGQIQYETMHHEMGHHLLWKNKRIGNHDARFDNHFDSWRLGREVTGRVIIFQYENNTTHYDIVLGNPLIIY